MHGIVSDTGFVIKKMNKRICFTVVETKMNAVVFGPPKKVKICRRLSRQKLPSTLWYYIDEKSLEKRELSEEEKPVWK